MAATDLQPPASPGALHLVQGRAVRPTDSLAAERMLRAYAADPQALASLRLALTVEGINATRLTDDAVLAELARRLVSGQWHLSTTRRPLDHWRPGTAERRVAHAPSERREPAVPDEETYVLVAEVRTIGGTLLPNHPVRVLDPDTGKVVVDEVDTDAKGVLRTRVPRDKTYRIEILDETWDAVEVPFVSDDDRAVLACRFVDTHGEPVAGEALEITAGDHSFTLETDADGCIAAAVEPGVYEVRLRGETFHAHTVLAADVAHPAAAEGEGDSGDEPADAGDPSDIEAHYLFVVPAEEGDEAADENDEHRDHRLERHEWFDAIDPDHDGSEEAVA